MPSLEVQDEQRTTIPKHPQTPACLHRLLFDVIRAVNARYYIRGYLMAELVVLSLKNRSTVSLGRRAYYERYVQREALKYLEQFTANLLFSPNGRLSPHEFRYRQH